MMAIFLSYIFSKIIMSSYQTEKVMESYGNVYYLQYASFTSREVMNDNIKKLDNYLIDEIDNKYYVYLGIYTNLDIAKKIKNIYEEKNIYTYIKNDYISDSELICLINEYETKLLDEENSSKIININNECLDQIKKRVS